MNNILDQLARNTGLLPDDLAAAILVGTTPPIEEIVMALVIGAMDAHAVVVGDPESSWNEKRLARMALAVAFLSALAVLGEAAKQCGVPTAAQEPGTVHDESRAYRSPGFDHAETRGRQPANAQEQ